MNLRKGKTEMVNNVTTESRHIAKMIKELRKKQKISRKALAERAGCSQRTIEYWETGERVPSDIDLVSHILSELGAKYTLGEPDRTK